MNPAHVAEAWRVFVWSEGEVRGNRSSKLSVEDGRGKGLIAAALSRGETIERVALGVVSAAEQRADLGYALSNLDGAVRIAMHLGWSVSRGERGQLLVQQGPKAAAGGMR